MRTCLAVLSHLAVWPALYVVASLVCTAQLADEHAHWSRLAAAMCLTFLTAIATYLLDRVKLKDSWLDPADAAAHPRRFAFLVQRARALRVSAACCLIGAIVAAMVLSPWAAALPVGAAVGVLFYAARPRRAHPRPKDLLLLKNSYVAAGVTGFVLLTLLALRGREHLHGFATSALAFAAVHLFLRVLADAALCDLDDEASDRRYGTATLPTTFGRVSAWNLAMVLRLGLALGLALIPWAPLRPRLAWAVVTAASTVALRLISPAALRDIVDIRFAIETAVVWLVLSW